ncbi:MAG: 50S ribosomal protein L19e [Candidatus Diapherotrites archaeon]|nr:50S ribosomal protein L19e [Candidatus Diapherotrites archaeon]
MKIKKVRKIAAEILGVGESKIHIDPNNIEKVKEAMTREDVENLINEKIITKIKMPFQSRARARELARKKKIGRRKNKGSRKGTGQTRAGKKKRWISIVRSQRKILKKLAEEAKEKGIYSKVYKMIKGGFFKGKKQLEKYIREYSREIEEVKENQKESKTKGDDNNKKKIK